ncbi:CoA transferase [Pengzhenrongella sicca]|uniref:CoA transferase n=1 Tax=Pengzhenrongella sicca TaxID=2819238 RepID=A0A8A4Z7R8_9MICO|nr:CoA transferase [Pengzhenrongella sicca]QTE27892.1 CoA transferase [Pengzhenrongella sicca]
MPRHAGAGATGGDVLATAWQALGGDPALLAGLTVRGDVGLASPFAVESLALGAVGAQVLAAAELAAQEHAGGARGADAQQHAVGHVELDARHVGIAFRSERFLEVDAVASGPGFAPLSRFIPTADGSVRLHANYPQHRAAIARALGPDPLAAAARLTGPEVEDRVVAAGGVAAVVRTAQEWRQHPQGQALEALPLVQLERVAAGPRAPTRPVPSIRGLRVLDLTRVLAGPIGTRTLASYGADVLRVDNPRSPEDPATLLETGPGKRHVELDLAAGADRDRFDELLDHADVLVQGYRPGALAALGLHPDRLAQRWPDLVVVTLSAWGTSGPWSGRRGFDSVVQAATGIADGARDAAGAPGVLPAQALDHGAGHLIAALVLRALTRRRREGGTWHGELSLAGLASWLTAAPRPAGPPSAPVEPVDAAPYLVRLPSAAGVLTLVRPPGSPTWPAGPVHLAPAEARWRDRGPTPPAGRGGQKVP